MNSHHAPRQNIGHILSPPVARKKNIRKKEVREIFWKKDKHIVLFRWMIEIGLSTYIAVAIWVTKKRIQVQLKRVVYKINDLLSIVIKSHEVQH